MCNPRASHMAATKHILRYLKETTRYDLLFLVSLNEFEDYLEAWSDDKVGVTKKHRTSCLFQPVGPHRITLKCLNFILHPHIFFM